MESFGIESSDIREIGFIHGCDEVVVSEIGGLNLAGGSVDPIAMFDQAFRHSRVGRSPLMVADGASGIDDEIISPPRILAKLRENDLCGRRAADVAHADKQNTVGAFGCG